MGPAKIPLRDWLGRLIGLPGIGHGISRRKRDEELQAAQLRLIESAKDHSVLEVLSHFLDEAEKLTGSEIGFFHFVEEDQQTIWLQTWSTNTRRNMCTAAPDQFHYPLARGGVWVDCVRHRKPVVHDDYAGLPHKKGLPPGHAPVIRELVVPVLRENRIVAILGVGNKGSDYREDDVVAVQKFADLAWEIIERKRAEAELADRSAELQRSNAELEQFAYAVSHDMRQPLRMVNSYLQLLSKSLAGKLDVEQQEFIDQARSGAARMDQMILGLLEYSRVGRRAVPEPLPARRPLEEALAFLAPTIAESGAQIAVAGEWPEITAVRDEMVRLWQNLIGNAVKYVPPGVVPRVEIAAVVAADHWRVEIRDNGIGVDPRQTGRLFKVFSRLQSRGRYEGNGLGLALCRRIVEHRGGEIGVESAGEGRGSLFWFTLPLSSPLPSVEP